MTSPADSIARLKHPSHSAMSSEERLRKLQQTTSSSHLSFDEKVQDLLRLGLEAFNLDIGILSNVRAERYIVINAVTADNSIAKHSEFPLGDTYCRHTLSCGNPTSTHHAVHSQWKNHPCYEKFRLEAYIGSPVTVDGKVFGTLNFSSPHPHLNAFDKHDHEFLQLMAQWVGLELERRQSEQKLQQFKTTLDQTLDCVFMFSADTLQFIYVNQGAMDQVGYSHEELMRMTPVDIKPEFNDRRFQQIIRSLANGTQSTCTFETMHQHRNGQRIAVEIFLQYIAPPDEEARFVAIVRDITERRKIDKMKSEFISTVSHELRTPLTSIHGSLGLIKGLNEGGMPDKTLSLIEIAHSNSERLLALINDILDMEKVASGNMRLDCRSYSLRALLNKTLASNQGYAEKYAVTFCLNPTVPDVEINVDADRFEQIMANLLSNAAKFSPPGEQIDISTTLRDGNVRIAVQDHGNGIPEEFRSRIFSKFSQADASDSRQKGGTGLGLSISKALVEEMSGKISFETDADLGTCFFLDLPAS
jgi:PAS domain S-box-containing protein